MKDKYGWLQVRRKAMQYLKNEYNLLKNEYNLKITTICSMLCSKYGIVQRETYHKYINHDRLPNKKLTIEIIRHKKRDIEKLDKLCRRDSIWFDIQDIIYILKKNGIKM